MMGLWNLILIFQRVLETQESRGQAFSVLVVGHIFGDVQLLTNLLCVGVLST